MYTLWLFDTFNIAIKLWPICRWSKSWSRYFAPCLIIVYIYLPDTEPFQNMIFQFAKAFNAAAEVRQWGAGVHPQWQPGQGSTLLKHHLFLQILYGGGQPPHKEMMDHFDYCEEYITLYIYTYVYIYIYTYIYTHVRICMSNFQPRRLWVSHFLFGFPSFQVHFFWCRHPVIPHIPSRGEKLGLDPDCSDKPRTHVVCEPCPIKKNHMK